MVYGMSLATCDGKKFRPTVFFLVLAKDTRRTVAAPNQCYYSSILLFLSRLGRFLPMRAYVVLQGEAMKQ
jgi:hypothetical protein